MTEQAEQVEKKKRARREPQFMVRVIVTAANRESLQKKLAAALGEDIVAAQFSKLSRNPSRGEQLADAASLVDEAKGIVEDLKDQMQNWKDSIPENLQDGDKASEVDEAISALETIESELDSVRMDDVSFPSVF